MSYYIGLDGGGSKTEAALSDQNLQVLSRVKGGPTNYHSVGIDHVRNEIECLLSELLSKASIHINDIEGICFGGAGIDSQTDKRVIEQLFNDYGYTKELKIYNDALPAMVAILGEPKGGILISGTGSIAQGVSKNGELVRVGGWGHVIDDVGSGYNIGKDALSAIMQSYDGRIKKSLLWEHLRKELKIEHQEDLVGYVYAPERRKQDIAALAKSVIALDGFDPIAESILDKAAKELCLMIQALAVKMEIDKFKLGLCGSVLTANNSVTSRLANQLNDVLPDVTLAQSKERPYMGALRMASNRYRTGDLL